MNTKLQWKGSKGGMDMNEIVQAIGSVGFPIVACCGMFYLYNETITKIVNALDVLNKSIELLAGELKDREKDKEE